MTTGVPYFPVTIASNTVVGRLAGGAGPTEAIPFATLAAALGVGGDVYMTATNIAGTNTITGVTATAPVLAANQVVFFTPANTNTGATTFNRDALGPVNVFCNGAALIGSELQAGIPTLLLYDGTQYNILEALATADGQVLVINAADPTKKIRFSLTGLTTATTRVITLPDYNVTLGNMPAGVIMDYGGSSVPTGWLECDGSAVSRTTYAGLFTAIATTWGTGDGSTTFNIPDFRGRARIAKGTGTVAESVAAASVNTGTETWTVTNNNSKWITGQAVVLTTTTTLPAPLALATTYYLIRASATTIQFATTLALAQAGTPINLTTQGVGTHTLTGTLTARTLAEIGGEETHAMSSTELLAHLHTAGTLSTSAGVVGGGGTFALGGSDGTGGVAQAASGSTASTGGNAAMNIMQSFAATMAIIKY